ncbi:MAG: hypothetical protein J6U20_11390 [Fibrobacter sp.]|nr:hypothetical protein [Fibrobacter sp.]
MKKFLFAITISLALAACGDDSSSNADDNSSTVIDTAIESDSSSGDKDTSSVDSDTSSSVADSLVTSSSSKVNDSSSATKAKEKSSSSKAKDSSTNKDSSSTKSSSSAPKDTSSTKKDSSSFAQNSFSKISDTYFANKKLSTTGTGSLSVDETQKTITLTPDPYFQKECVVESNGSVSWKDVDLTTTGFTAQYEFHEDSLLLSFSEESDSIVGLLIGGTPGNIYGTWSYPLCSYNRNTSEVKCEEERNQYITITYNFSPERYTGTNTLDYDAFVALYKIGTEDYRNSYFMSSLFSALYYGYAAFSPNELFIDLGAEEIQSDLESKHVTIVNNSNASQTFSINEKTYTISVNKADAYYNYYDFNGLEYIISLTVTDGNVTCQFDDLRMSLTQDLCKSEYSEYFSLDDEKDGNGNEYTRAEIFEKSNMDEFKKCIESIAVNQAP